MNITLLELQLMIVSKIRSLGVLIHPITTVDDILAVGSYSSKHKKVEILNTQRNKWATRPDYLFDEGSKAVHMY